MNLLGDKIFEKSFIQNLIPQKAPFVMVDKLLFFSKEKVVSGFTIPNENLFTSDNIFTAPGLIEHMAQSVALHTGYQYFLMNEDAPTGYIGVIKNLEILQLPNTDQELETSVQILHEIMGVTLVEIESKCNGQLIASSQMKTVLAN